MVGYIANNYTADLIKDICQKLNITILNQEVEKIDFYKYVKQTKVNFNLIKYLIIDLNQLENTEDEVIRSIDYFKEIYINTRVIIVAKGYDNQNVILTNLYDIGIYNIITSNEMIQIKEELQKCLLQGMTEKDSRRFKKIEEVKIDKNRKYKILISKVKEKVRPKEKMQQTNKETKTRRLPNSGVYFFAILLETVTRLIKLLCYIAVFLLTSIGLTFLFNEELRNIVVQIFYH